MDLARKVGVLCTYIRIDWQVKKTLDRVRYSNVRRQTEAD